MSDTELLIKEVQSLPPRCLREVLDFAGYLRQKYAQDTENAGIDGEYPGPKVRLDHTPNAVTRAAIEEGRAMMRGEIPANRFNSLEEMLEALHN
jgi:hypothetical protein